jgi:hypothetical protein
LGRDDTNDKEWNHEFNREASEEEQESRASEKARAQDSPYVRAQPHG